MVMNTTALRVPGVHNALNALAAMLAVSKAGEADFDHQPKPSRPSKARRGASS
ncbi:MAG: hypothetical protein U0521_08415 [Anaerolineae bacterium]